MDDRNSLSCVNKAEGRSTAVIYFKKKLSSTVKKLLECFLIPFFSSVTGAFLQHTQYELNKVVSTFEKIKIITLEYFRVLMYHRIPIKLCAKVCNQKQKVIIEYSQQQQND